MKKKILILLLPCLLGASLLSACGSGSEFDQMYASAQKEFEKAEKEAQEEFEKQVEELQKEASAESEVENAEPDEGSADLNKQKANKGKKKKKKGKSKKNKSVEKKAGKKKTGSYSIDGINVTYYDSVRNDVTGNWRLAVIYDGADLKDYVVDFYNEFITDDSEVFGIVNLGTKTTALVSKVMSDQLDVTVMEYVDKEEHDANKLFSGQQLERFWINTKTGEIDPVEDDE